MGSSRRLQTAVLRATADQWDWIWKTLRDAANGTDHDFKRWVWRWGVDLERERESASLYDRTRDALRRAEAVSLSLRRRLAEAEFEKRRLECLIEDLRSRKRASVAS